MCISNIIAARRLLGLSLGAEGTFDGKTHGYLFDGYSASYGYTDGCGFGDSGRIRGNGFGDGYEEYDGFTYSRGDGNDF